MKLQSVLWAVLTICLASASFGQTISSTLKGTVQDSTGAVVPNASCKLTNSATGSALTVASAQDGAFQFLDILAGTYTLTVSAPGFKNYDKVGIEILSSEFHSAGNVVLQVGQSSESITVIEAGTPVQTSSGERSDT